MAMKRSEAEKIIGMLASFAKLDQTRLATDEVGWVALKLSRDRRTAERKIAQARRLLGMGDK